MQFAQFYHQHQKLVRSVIFQITGLDALDDLVQDTFIKLWKSLHEYRGDAAITSWIYRVSVNAALDHLRKSKRRIEYGSVDAEAAEEPEPEGVSPEDEVASRELLNQALASLSDDQRTVVVLSYLHDLSLAQIAQVLDVSEGTVKSRLFYARETLRSFIGANC